MWIWQSKWVKGENRSNMRGDFLIVMIVFCLGHLLLKRMDIDVGKREKESRQVGVCQSPGDTFTSLDFRD